MGMNSAGRILVADDDEAFRSATLFLLRGRGYECDDAATGQEAAEKIQNNQYDLLISDIMMPGNQDLQLIRTTPKLREGLPVILVTGFPTVQSAVQSVGLSVASYLIKPVKPAILIETVAGAVERTKSRRIIADARMRFQATCSDMEQLENTLCFNSDAAVEGSVKLFLDLILKNVASSLQDLKSLVNIATSSIHSVEDLHSLQSSHPFVLLDAVKETIIVIEKTKKSFRSKELGELRKKLETLLNTTSAPENKKP
jgi:DNA-binding response OmpR family regulator